MPRTAKDSHAPIPARNLLSRGSWKPLPPLLVLEGSCEYFKARITDRFARELFGEEPREVRRHQGPESERDLGDLPLSAVLDDLRTPSFLSPSRLVVVERAQAFARAHLEDILAAVRGDTAGGHLILFLDHLDRRTRAGKAAAEECWVVRCDQPYDRPPPWETGTPPWESDLSRWLVTRGREYGLDIDTRTAFLLHDRAGTDLGVLDQELDKIATFLQSRGQRRVTPEVVGRVAGELGEVTIFEVADLLLEGRRKEAVRACERLFQLGTHDASGNRVQDSTAIAIFLTSTLVHRLRALRRAHLLAARGGTRDDWLREKLVGRPFLSRFERQLRATPPARIAWLLKRLYWTDSLLKRGGDPRRLLVLLTVEATAGTAS